jgi:hypothetical protein
VEGLVAEAVRGHPGTLERAAAACRVLGHGLPHELNAHEDIVAVAQSKRASRQTPPS